MATVHRLPTPAPAEDQGVVTRFTRLLRLELELGLTETRNLVRSLVLAVAIGVPAAIALIASLVVLVAGAVSPFFGAPWKPLVIAGGGVALLSLIALAWSAWRLTHLSWPTETLRSFEENWRWLAAQLRSRLTLRSHGV
jgi:uncharacterized membrane protein YqjE